jgi:hypothetical protein
MLGPMLFVCGCPRSGTTMLHGILSAHPEVAIGLERWNTPLLAGRLRPLHFDEARFFDIRRGETWYDSLDTFADYHAQLRAKYATARWHGDKVPRAYEAFGALASAFAEPRFVFILRNVISVARSWEARRARGVHWPGDWDARAAVQHWNRSLHAVLDWVARVPILPIIYEDLVEQEAPVLALARFLDIDPAPLLARRARMVAARGEAKPASGPSLTDQELRHILREADFHALAAVERLAERPLDYAGAWRVAGAPPAALDKYSGSDRAVVDYATWQPKGCRAKLRGPAVTPEEVPGGVLCLGSAATFGRAVRRPFAQQIAARLGVPVANGAIGGARPATFLGDPGLQPYIRRAGAVVIEAVSARGYATEVFTPNNAYTNVGVAAEPIAAGMVPMARPAGRFVDNVYRAALRIEGTEPLWRARMVCLAAWMRDMRRLAQMTAGRGVLLWFSQRAPDYSPGWESLDAWNGGFPHHIDRAAIEALRPHFAAVVEVVSRAGLPERALDAASGEPVGIFAGTPDPTLNTYYPSQAMHDEAAAALAPVIQALLAKRAAAGEAMAG